MPTYTYECKKCGHTHAVFHPISATPRIKCEVCGGTCKRLLGAGAGIIFKGSGFYETDYKKGDGKAVGAPSSADAERKADKKTEAKPEAKPESKSGTSKSVSSSDKS
ncbi:MAG TPA: zinc ribbon domain-containing protein [Candidatus Hydrogenedentes bacterium]|nr:zinc ribbon domain-containing protein [Candidatus Hydrogenedentota bacterium]